MAGDNSLSHIGRSKAEDKDVEKVIDHYPEGAPTPPPTPKPRDVRIAKSTRMLASHSTMLFTASFERTRDKGDKVSEADCLEEATTLWKVLDDARRQAIANGESPDPEAMFQDALAALKRKFKV